VHKYDSPLKSCKPKASVSIRLVLSDDDRVRDRQQAHLQRREEEESRGELSDNQRGPWTAHDDNPVMSNTVGALYTVTCTIHSHISEHM
jgi:hypothetical protein